MNAFRILEAMLYVFLEQVFSCKAIYLPYKRVAARLDSIISSRSVTLSGIFQRFIFCAPESYSWIHVRMSNASFWFMFNHSQLNGLKCAFKGPDCIWRANWNHIAYPRDQIGTVLVIALWRWQNESVRLVFLTVTWALLLGCACTSTTYDYRSPYKSIAINWIPH